MYAARTYYNIEGIGKICKEGKSRLISVLTEIQLSCAMQCNAFCCTTLRPNKNKLGVMINASGN